MCHYYYAINEIIDYLYIGNSKGLQLPDNDFSLVVNCNRDTNIPEKYNNFIHIPILENPFDSNSLLIHMEKTNVLEKIRDRILKKQKVFVFCNSGIQKSASVIACYLMKYSKITPKEAVRFIKSKHPIAFLDDVAYISAMEYFHRHLNPIST